jgi:hypothetical protein
VLYTIDGIILILQQERRQRLAGDMNIRIQPKTVSGKRQVPRIDSHRKVGAAACFVSRIYSRVQTLLKVRAHRCHQITARRKPQHSNLVRIDMPLRT